MVIFCSLYPAILLNLLLSSRNLFVCSFWFSPYTVLSSANKDGFPFSFQSVFLIPFIGWNVPIQCWLEARGARGKGQYIWHFTFGTGLAVGSTEAPLDGGGTLQLQPLCFL